MPANLLQCSDKSRLYNNYTISISNSRLKLTDIHVLTLSPANRILISFTPYKWGLIDLYSLPQKLWQLLATVFSSSSTITSLMVTELCQIFYLRFTPSFINGTTRLIVVVDWSGKWTSFFSRFFSNAHGISIHRQNHRIWNFWREND